MKKYGRGFTLVEIAVVLVIIGILSVAMARYAVGVSQSNKARAIADQMKTITGGVGTMLSANFEPLAASSPVAGFADPFRPTIAELRTTGYLANNVQDNNLAGTGWRVLIKRVPTGCVAPACDLTALVYSSAGFTLKNGNPDTLLANKVSEFIGNDGGVSRDGAPGTISGPDGLWTTTNPLGATKAVVAMQTGFGAQGLSQFVRQGDSRAITLGNTLAVSGNTTVGGTLGITGATTMSGNASVGGTLGVTGATTLTGNLTANGNTTLGNASTDTVTIAGATTMNNTLTMGSATAANRNISGVNTITATAGNITTVSATDVTASNQVQMAQGYVTGAATEGGACSPNGIFRQAAGGLLLSCQSGVWRKAAGSSGVVLKVDMPSLFAGRTAQGGGSCAWSQNLVVNAAGSALAFGGLYTANITGNIGIWPTNTNYKFILSVTGIDWYIGSVWQGTCPWLS